MPTYEYRCSEGHEFEVFQRMSDAPVAECPECGEKAERVLSGGAGVLFRGEGFYATDYRSEEYRKKASAETGGSEKKGADGKSSGGDDGPSGGSGGGESSAPSSSSASSDA